MKLPPIRRSRGFRLYSRDGRRFLDFWQEGGGGILGARTSPAVNLIKNDLEAGRFYRLPADGARRLERAVLELFPAYCAIRVYPNLEEALARASEAGLSDPRLAEWQPFLPLPESPVLLVRPPLPESLRPAILLFKEAARALEIPPGAPAAFQHRAAGRALSDARREETIGLPEREASWKLFDSLCPPGIFERRGPYLRPLAPSGYEALFERFLRGGVLLSPDPASPSIVPGNFDAGELSFLKEEPR